MSYVLPNTPAIKLHQTLTMINSYYPCFKPFLGLFEVQHYMSDVRATLTCLYSVGSRASCPWNVPPRKISVKLIF